MRRQSMHRSIYMLSLVLLSNSIFSQTNVFPTNANVGIGTTTPGTTLQVNGHTSLGDAYDGTGYGLVQIARPSSPGDNKFHLSFIRTGSGVSGMGYLPGSNSLGIWVGTSNAGVPTLTMTTDQKVGIGSAIPASLLHVHNATAPTNTIGAISEVASFSGDIGNLGMFKFLFRRHTLSGDWTHVSSKLQYITDVTHQGYLEFNPPGEPYGLALGTGSTEIMRLKLNGYVGIGTNNPQEKLQIGDRFTLGDGGWKMIGYNMAWDFNQSINARLVTAPASCMFFTDLGNILFQTAPSGAAGTSVSNGVHSLVIHNSGQVGIGTAFTKTSFTDLNYKLFVEGGIRARKVKVDQASWPDYVFDGSYHLLSLKEVETFIGNNKHLPGIVSAKQVETEGLDLGDNQSALLKKVEELTLYIIGQQKEIEILKQQMLQVKKHSN